MENNTLTLLYSAQYIFILVGGNKANITVCTLYTMLHLKPLCVTEQTK